MGALMVPSELSNLSSQEQESFAEMYLASQLANMPATHSRKNQKD